MGLTIASSPDRAVPSFMRTPAVPAPPTNIENLNLSQVFRTSSSQPAADSAYPDFRKSEVERSETSDFVPHVSQHKESNLADSRRPKAAIFKVPYRNTKPVAKVSRQETMTVASGWQLDSRQRKTAETASGINNIALSTDDNQKTPRNQTVPEGNSNTAAKTRHFQPLFSGAHEYAATTQCHQDTVVSSSAGLCSHVGDTPLALSGM